ncbi:MULTISPECIES: hypothetical protein [unclassified Microcoleus]|uniref:hypothetical protein n=1 Tax=unclassified Microcoleus TaxID=2642155 RepID=UPI001DE50F14|nr:MULTISPECIES: hypothetical protein [unclassified Microcoleus]MCC3421829.1 hypothetical protein [Microcoleus sp. PH2017_07_MST_O_A]MCC3431838.1 hypothetical protein [Microcoleus sp. PH2017_04_SCI_O_A]MCC3439582.1 hypothetical protein [Microcoleus sp. PH2017_05_CCC_O_A]MCC3444321.1 hypothetical protein [Microcoleus sp. PH2017_03_ELD_O_A]MCC3457807.1 hypothetical protein [Microcoleus sp. PH2017_08_TRC_O_A]MCC3469050.1 hypothetical protein [Microcoleus sp. PH2017_06_SFM_O_A]MCC3507243.1 hypot
MLQSSSFFVNCCQLSTAVNCQLSIVNCQLNETLSILIVLAANSTAGTGCYFRLARVEAGG